jgi:ATP-binding cassette subfamily B protein
MSGAPPTTAEAPAGPAGSGRVLGRALRLIAPSAGLAIPAVVLLVASTLCALAGPIVLRYAIDHGLRGVGIPRGSAPGLAGGTTPRLRIGANLDLGVIRRATGAYLALALAAVVSTFGHTRLAGVVGERFIRDLRNRVFNHLVGMSTRFFDAAPAGRLISRLTADVDALQDLVQLALVQFVQGAFTLCALGGLLFVLSWRLALVALVPVPLLAVASRAFQVRSRRAYQQVRERVSQTLGTLVESLAGIKVVQSFGQEPARLRRFLDDNQRQLDANLGAIRVQARFLPVVELSTLFTTVLTLAAGGWGVARGWVSLGTVSAFALYLLMAFEPIQSLSFLFNTLQSAGAALDKLFGLLDEPLDLHPGSAELPERAELTLHDAGFGYGPTLPPALTGVTLAIPHGARLALVGATGAGKSTLAKLLARLYDPTTGSVHYGGVDLRQASTEALRRRVVMVAQEGHLFQGSIADNIRAVRPDASDADVEDALRCIDAYERFAAFPQGLASPVGARGALLSSGERQLVALARLALLDADVLILDEATSSLDPGTEQQINRALERLMVDRTVVLIAHRLSTMERVDRIAVVADAGIAELGSHAELLERGGLYATLYRQWQQARLVAD